MISVKQATQSASDFIRQLYSDTFHSTPEQPIFDTRLEEVELSEDGKYWFITLSFPSTRTISILTRVPAQRQYKICKVDATTGEVLSMKIRELAHEAA